MNIEDVMEWIQLAEDDFDSAKILNESARKHYEIICYHCAQAAEKYLKGYLTYKDIIPEKTHDLRFLNNLCMEEDNNFEDIITECAFINKFANDIRYPHKYETHEDDVAFSINAIEKIKNCKPILDLRNIITNKGNNGEKGIVK
jgi:HEPN domain-containing protein